MISSRPRSPIECRAETCRSRTSTEIEAVPKSTPAGLRRDGGLERHKPKSNCFTQLAAEPQVPCFGRDFCAYDRCAVVSRLVLNLSGHHSALGQKLKGGVGTGTGS